jgi:Rieske Fe-S protein
LADRADIPEGPNGGSGSEEKPKPAGYYEGESMTRRGVFMVGGQALGGVAAVAVLLPVVGFAAAPIFETPDEVWTSVGATDEFDPTSYRAVTLTIVSGIGEAGKTTAYVRKGKPGEEIDGENGYVAISTRCAHLGCPVRYVAAAANFICPCHGGVYDFEGKVIGGPPVRPLDRFQTRVRNGQVEVGPRFSVTSQLEPVRTRDPGEFTGGIWEYLYPPRPSTPPAP